MRTVLSRGIKDNKGVSPVTPEDVAAAIVDALQHPRPDVYVLKSLGPAVRTAHSRRASWGVAQPRPRW